jgi:predicted GNAT family acetyltransferase
MGGRIGQKIGAKTSGGGGGGSSVDFVVSHSFTGSNGNEVTQYSVSSGHGGYARVEKSPDGYIINNVIIDEAGRGKGAATRLYLKVNKQSVKATGKTLQSIKKDRYGKIELSSDGKALWESFVKKGLAKKIGKGRYRFV